ncbi:MAG: hypothetical protein K8J08_14225 [Thermoanaerobaculia bacterium]|nr:hypothetical protein [Thermoanaerobaculia bacterium]
MNDYPSEGNRRKTSPCLYMFLGCGLAVVLAVVIMVVGVTLLARKGQKFAESMADPSARAEKVASILGVEEFPEGYYPMLGVSIPFVMDLAMLTDQEPDASGEPKDFHERGFIYLDSRAFAGQRQDLIDYLQGGDKRPDFFDNVNVDVELDFDHPVQRGRFDIEGVEHLFAAYRGEFDSGGDSIEGLQVLTYVACDDDRLRLGISFGPDNRGSDPSFPAPSEPSELPAEDPGFEVDPPAVRPEVEATGATPLETADALDVEALADFYRHFSLCR